MKDKLYIIGAGGVGGHVAYNYESYDLKYELAGFFDDDPKKIGTKQFGYPVLGPVHDIINIRSAAVVIGIAFPSIKKNIIAKLSANSDFQFPTLIHERAWVSNNVEMGNGCIVYPGTTINFSSKIGNFVVINVNCSLGHHTRIGAFSSLAPGVNMGGHTNIEEGVDVGIGVSILQGVKVGSDSILGGQSMIIEDVRSTATMVGVPAKEIKK